MGKAWRDQKAILLTKFFFSKFLWVSDLFDNVSIDSSSRKHNLATFFKTISLKVIQVNGCKFRKI